jgi:iron complex outermembrane receptor protein
MIRIPRTHVALIGAVLSLLLSAGPAGAEAQPGGEGDPMAPAIGDEATAPGREPSGEDTTAPGGPAPETPADAEAVEPLAPGEEAILFQEIPSVYGASKFEQKITEAPSFVTLITAEEIKRYGYRTVAEILASATGFFVTYDRDYNYLGIRGFNRPGDFNTRVLMLVDGHRVNDNLYDQAGIGTEALIDVDLIDRVEIIRGPSSSLYGTNAFLGVINVITKRGRDLQGTEVAGGVGSFESYKGRLTYGNRFANGVELLVSASEYLSEGQESLFFREFADPATNNGYVLHADDDEAMNLSAKASYRDLGFQAAYVSREKGIPTAAYGTVFPTDRTRSTDEHGYVSANYEHQFENQLNLLGTLYYDWYHYQGDYLYDYSTTGTPDLVLNRDQSYGEWWGAELKADRTFFDDHKLTGGAEYRDNFRQDLRNYDTSPPFVYLDENRNSYNWAVFVQDEYSIIENLILNAGVRYDYYDTFGGTVNPRAALIYNVWSTTIKALYGQAFRAPNAYEQFYVGTGFKSNPDLDPEHVKTYELVLEHPLTEHLRGSMAGYYYRIDDLVSQETDPADGLLIFLNRGKTEAKGLEFQLEMDNRGPFGIGGRLGYALQRAEDRRTGDRLTNSPTHLAKLNVSVPILPERIFAGVEVLYTSDRETLAGHTSNGFATTSATLLGKNLLPGLELSATVRNIFDSDYTDPGSGEHVQDEIAQDGRSYWVKLKYAF